MLQRLFHVRFAWYFSKGLVQIKVDELSMDAFEHFVCNPTPIVGGLPLLQAAPGRPAIMPQEPYARTKGETFWSSGTIHHQEATIQGIFSFFSE